MSIIMQRVCSAVVRYFIHGPAKVFINFTFQKVS